jgi:hypothetical protein
VNVSMHLVRASGTIDGTNGETGPLLRLILGSREEMNPLTREEVRTDLGGRLDHLRPITRASTAERGKSDQIASKTRRVNALHRLSPSEIVMAMSTSRTMREGTISRILRLASMPVSHTGRGRYHRREGEKILMWTQGKVATRDRTRATNQEVTLVISMIVGENNTLQVVLEDSSRGTNEILDLQRFKIEGITRNR